MESKWTFKEIKTIKQKISVRSWEKKQFIIGRPVAFLGDNSIVSLLVI